MQFFDWFDVDIVTPTRMPETHPDAAATGHRSAVVFEHATQGFTLLFRTLKNINFQWFQVGFSV